MGAQYELALINENLFLREPIGKPQHPKVYCRGLERNLPRRQLPFEIKALFFCGLDGEGRECHHINNGTRQGVPLNAVAEDVFSL